MTRRQCVVILAVAVVLVILGLAGCSFILDNNPAMAPNRSHPLSGLPANEAEYNAEPRLANRIAVEVVQRSVEFQSISASVRNARNPDFSLIDTSLAVVVFSLELSEDETLREGEMISHPYAMFFVDLRDGLILAASRAKQSLRTGQVRVLDLITGEESTLTIPKEALRSTQEERESRAAAYSEGGIKVEPKHICEESLEEPYEDCYDVEVCEPGHFNERTLEVCVGACPSLFRDPYAYVGCIGACYILCWEPETCTMVEECQWIYPCDW